MREIMAETTPDVEAKEASPEEFAALLLENARNMARYSIGETPPPDFALEKASDLEIARYLSRVEVDDKKLSTQIKEALDKNLSDPETIFQATSLAAAKAEASKEVVVPKDKKALESFAGRMTRRAFLKAVPILLPAVATACGVFDARANMPWPPESSPTPQATEVPPTVEATQIAPSPSEESEVAPVVSQRLMTEQEVMDIIGSEGLTPAFDEKYSEFQEEMGLNFPSSTFERWGIEAETADGGTIISPFFEVQDSEGQSQVIAIVILLESGGFRYVRLEPVEVQSPDGRMYLTLSQTINAETGGEMSPEPMFWVPYSSEEWSALSDQEKEATAVYFNGLGGIIPEAQPIEGVKIAAIRTLATPEARIEGEWMSEVVGSHGTVMRLVIDRQVREREAVSIHEIRFVDVNLLNKYWGGQEGFVESYLQLYESYGEDVSRELMEEFVSALWAAFPEGRSVDSLEMAFLRAVFERGREVGLFSGLSFEGYVLAVEEAHRSGNSSRVSVPLTEGNIIDTTRPVTFAFIDPDTADERGGLVHVGSSTESWVDYVYFLRGPVLGGQIPGHDPLGQWKRLRWQIGFDTEGGVVFAYILDERLHRIDFSDRAEDPARAGSALLSAIESMLLSIQKDRFLNTSGGTGNEIWEITRGSDFINESLEIFLGYSSQGGRMGYPILYPINANFQY